MEWSLLTNIPRWLLDNDHDEEGIVVIANLYGGGDIHNDKARQEYREIKMNVLLQRQEGERSYYEMFRKYYKRLFIAMSAQALAQLNGINVISYYAPLVFESAGWVGRGAILMTGINGITYLLSTIPPWYLVDKWGRRKILMSGAIAMIISLSAISYFIFIDIRATPVLTVLFVMIYNASFGASWGPIPWLYPPEILPLSIRAKGASLSTASNWFFNYIVGELTPILQEWIKWRLYLVHAFFCAVSFVLGKCLPDEAPVDQSLLTEGSIFLISGDGQRPVGRYGSIVWRCNDRDANSRPACRSGVFDERPISSPFTRHSPRPWSIQRGQRYTGSGHQPPSKAGQQRAARG